MSDIKYILRFIGIMLIVEGLLILSCLIPAFHFHDGTWTPILSSGLFTCSLGTLLTSLFRHAHKPNLLAMRSLFIRLTNA